ncbi:MAG: hypothetical protein AB2L09_11005 [Coriobacteriia bacterium]
MLEFVIALKPEQALGSPWRNQNPEHVNEMVCEFGGNAEGRDLYIKVAVVGLEGEAAGCVISFHFAEKPFEFPYRQ